MSVASQLAAPAPPAPTVPRRRRFDVERHPVAVAFVAAAVLHLLWWWLFADGGGDLAAQDAWAAFAREHPGSAYNMAWYGGMHPASYSPLSPYVMALLGVRTTLMVSGTLAATLAALLVARSGAVRRPLLPALYGAFALTGNTFSGRATFSLGTAIGLAALALVFAGPERWTRGTRIPRGVLGGAAVLSAIATACSPVAGLFLGVVAAALWIERRRTTAYALGVPPVLVVALSAWLFPFSGEQPMPTASVILPVAIGVAGILLAPTSWRTVRIGSALYVAGVLATWVVPSPVGSNVVRLGLVFGGILLVSMAVAVEPLRRPHPRWRLRGPLGVGALLALAIVTSSAWQVGVAARDAISTKPTEAWSLDFAPLVSQLQAADAELGRVEVVPTRSHREAAALAPYVNLARGWNRQADAARNKIFYEDDLLNAESYHAWLDRWAVRYVVLAEAPPDAAAVEEDALVRTGLDYLTPVWSDANWTLYAVDTPAPLADLPAVVLNFDAAETVLYLPRAATVVVRIPASPWLSLVDAEGQAVAPPTASTPDGIPVNVNGCLSPLAATPTSDGTEDTWVALHAPEPGIYRLGAPYTFERGTACPASLILEPPGGPGRSPAAPVG